MDMLCYGIIFHTPGVCMRHSGSLCHPLTDAYVSMGREDDGAQCNGDFVTHLSSTVCTVNPSIQDPSGRADRWSPE